MKVAALVSLLRHLVVGPALLLACVAAQAADAPALESGLEQQVRQLALEGTRHAAAGVTRVEVEVGQLDPRLRLAPCEKVQPYLPSGARLWGKSRIGLRCVQGASPWNVSLPITVKVYGMALVATVSLPAGSVLAADDLTQAEVDLAEDSSVALAEPGRAIGRTLVRALNPGQGLRQSNLKQRQWFAAGETVKLVASGEGFSVSGEGMALTPGMEGQPARIRTESGRVLSAMPVADRVAAASL
jgi:flagella basal body P-ring formation protein FlgA